MNGKINTQEDHLVVVAGALCASWPVWQVNPKGELATYIAAKQRKADAKWSRKETTLALASRLEA